VGVGVGEFGDGLVSVEGKQIIDLWRRQYHWMGEGQGFLALKRLCCARVPVVLFFDFGG